MSKNNQIQALNKNTIDDALERLALNGYLYMPLNYNIHNEPTQIRFERFLLTFTL